MRGGASIERRGAERGHLMVGLMAMVAVLTILSTVGFQAWQDVVRRDREAEMMFRCQEIVRALRRYQKDQGALPLELKKLVEPGSRGQYFLRRLYDDPLVKDGKWGLLFLAPGGGVYDPNGVEGEGGLDAEGNPVVGRPDPFGRVGGTDPASARPGTPSRAGQAGSGPWGRSKFAAQPGGGASGEQGLPIVGVKSLCTDKPFRVFRDQTEYSKWLFTIYDQDLMPALPGQQPNPALVPGGGARPPGTVGGNRPPGTPPGTGGLGTKPN